jgi:hypothetical protein
VQQVQLLSASDCALPAGHYGDYSPGRDGSFRYTWPNEAGRAERYTEPCVFNFLKLGVTDTDGQVSTGWVAQKAVADYTRFDFPFSWDDPQNAALRDRRGVNRAAYLSTRLLFEDGASLYLGNSPLWVVTLSQLGELLADPSGNALGALLLGPAEKCAGADPGAAAPCILGKQRPFIFPNHGDGLWVVDALDSASPHYDASNLGGNPVELSGAFDADSLATAWSDTLAFFDAKAAAETDWKQATEQLGAMWHSLTNYNKNWDRYRMAVVPLDEAEELLLLVPDQGYFDLGQPDPALLERLLTADLAQALLPPEIPRGASYQFEATR